MSNDEPSDAVLPARSDGDKLCLKTIEEGEAVDIGAATDEMPKALVVAIARSSSGIVGVGAIKRKRPKYASGIAAKGGYNFDPNMHELGYVSVTKSHQGRRLSKEIVALLLESTTERPLFATTSNPKMKSTLEHAGFIKCGNEWRSPKGNLLSLWLLE